MSALGMTQNEIVEAFREAMRSHEIDYDGPIDADGSLHRVAAKQDAGKRTTWYVLHGSGPRPAGVFGTWRGGLKWSWKPTGAAPLSAEDRRAWAAQRGQEREARGAATKAQHAAAAQVARTMWEAATQVDEHPYLKRKGVPAYGLRVGEWVQELSRDPVTGEIRQRQIPNTLLIPIRDAKREIHSLQAIFAEPTSRGSERPGKLFLKGGRKAGLWFSIGKPTELDGSVTIVIVEGYATGASVHMATGLGVIVAFDAGNLEPVAREIRRIMPNARILISADNDLWTMSPVANPGMTLATAAAAAVRGLVVAPCFLDVTAKPTDFNDLHTDEGLPAVKRQILAALRPMTSQNPQLNPSCPAMAVDAAGTQGGSAPRAENRPASDDRNARENRYFKVMGHDRDGIYVYHYKKHMIFRRRTADWPEAALTDLAPLHWWECEFPGRSGMIRKSAIDWLQREGETAGFFNPDIRRGRGAWVDEQRVVFHIGNRLIVNGEDLPLSQISSRFIYEQGALLPPPATLSLSATDGEQIIKAAQMFRWTRPASAILLAGWVTLAPVCGALRWRPHVWLTGGPGSGKTTILDSYVSLFLNGFAVHAQGNSTEPGIRQSLGSDARPVILDEAEQNDEGEAVRMNAILALARQASMQSEAQTLKGTQGGSAMTFNVRSMFCLSSVQVGLKHQADRERFTVLGLRSKREAKQDHSEWPQLASLLSKLRSDPDLPGRLLRRTLWLLPTIQNNIKVFTQAASEKFGSQRQGDQYGTLLAGAWSLTSEEVATIDDARKMIAEYDWSEYSEDTEAEETDTPLATLLDRKIRSSGNDFSVFELICAAAGKPGANPDIPSSDADACLRRHGMALKWNGVPGIGHADFLVANSSTALQELMRGTPYAADLGRQLRRLTNASRHPGTSFNGMRARCVAFPLAWILDRHDATEPGE